MLKIKIFAIAAVLFLTGIVLKSSRQFSSHAQSDEVSNEIAEYKSWSKITKEPFKVWAYASTRLAV